MSPAISSEQLSQTKAIRQYPWKHVILTSLLLIVSLVPIWIGKYFPSQNAPWYMLSAYMLREMDNPDLAFSDFYVITYHPIPHSLHPLIVFGLMNFFPLLLAQKIALSLYVLLVPASIYYFLTVAAPDKKVLAYFSFVMIHTFSFYRGYHEFCLSVPIFFFAFGFWLKHRNDTARWPILVSALLVSVLYLAHLFGFLIFVCAVGWYRLVETGTLRKTSLSVIQFTWSGWILFADYVYLNLTTPSWVDKSEREWLSPHVSLEYFWRKFFYSISVPAYILGALISLWILWLLVQRIAHAVRNENQGWRKLFSDPFFSMITIMVIGYFVVPWKLWNWHYISVRLIPFIFGLSLACLGTLPDRLGRCKFQTLFIASIVFATLGINASLAAKVAQIQTHLENYTSGIEFFEEGATLLPIQIENPQFGQVRPLTRAHEYYHMAKGGANRIGAAVFNTLVNVRYRQFPIDSRLPPLDHHDPDSLAAVKKAYDFILIFGTDPEIEAAIAKIGFERVHQQGLLQLYRNRSTDGPSTVYSPDLETASAD